MIDLSHLSRAPFNLSSEDINWVRRTWDGLDEDARIGQVFNLMSRGDEPEERARIARLKPGGVTRFFGPDAANEKARLDAFQADAAVPLLVSADLEGSRMSLPFGTQVPNPLALSAIDDVAVTEEVSALMAQEARAVGVNWSFTPLLDINAAPRSPIVATRGFGADPARIARHALAQIRSFQSNEVAATAKHWPGEGHDDRDQHLVTTIIPLSVEDWEATHGNLYRQAIADGVLAVMSAHIAFPAFAAQHGAEGVELYRPASISPILNQQLLRERLGFNGVIVSDASEMAGLTAYVETREGKVEILTSGCDMVLFSNDIEADLAAVRAALRCGRLTEERLTDAGTRVLALKAALGLHRAQPERRLPDVAATAPRMAEVLRMAPVVEKDVAGLLPLDVAKHRRVLLFAPGIIEPLWNKTVPIVLPELLEKEGFEVTICQPGDEIDPAAHDLAIYAFSEETLLTRGRIFLDWAKIGGGLRGAMRRLWHEMPVLMVSFGYPYYLYDAPRVPTYVNAWATMDGMQSAVVDLLLGRADWRGTSPVDAFAGAPDARY